MKIKVNNDKLLIDDNEIKISELNQEFLDDVVNKSLLDDVEYELEGDHPLVKFFKTLQDGTKEGSALRQKMNEAERAHAAVVKDNSEEVGTAGGKLPITDEECQPKQ